MFAAMTKDYSLQNSFIEKRVHINLKFHDNRLLDLVDSIHQHSPSANWLLGCGEGTWSPIVTSSKQKRTWRTKSRPWSNRKGVVLVQDFSGSVTKGEGQVESLLQVNEQDHLRQRKHWWNDIVSMNNKCLQNCNRWTKLFFGLFFVLFFCFYLGHVSRAWRVSFMLVTDMAI